MGRTPCCGKVGLKKGPWTNDEDVLLVRYVEQHGEGNWRALPKAAGLLRCGKSCRLRWMNYLRPDLKRGNFAEDEEDLIVKLHSLLGNRWSLIAGRIPGRTDNEIKNYWNTRLSKKLVRKGMDHPGTGPNPFFFSANGVRIEKKQVAFTAEKKDIRKRKLEDLYSSRASDLKSVSQDTHPSLLRKNCLRSSDLESVSQDTHPNLLRKNCLRFPVCNIMPAERFKQHSEQSLQKVIELSDTAQDIFCSKSEIEKCTRLLPTSTATISSCLVQLGYHTDSTPHNENSSSIIVRPFSYDEIMPFAEFEPSSGMTSPDTVSSYHSVGTVYDPTFELERRVWHNQGGDDSLDYDHGRDFANDMVEIAQDDRIREASIVNILPDLEFLDESEVDDLWDILGISPITESSNADTIENDDTYWADILMEADTSI